MRKPLRAPDWSFGAVGRRLLLEALLLDDHPADGWTKQELETHAAVGAGGLDEVLAGALHLRLIGLKDGRWFAPEEWPPLADPLPELVAAVAELPDEPIPPLPRRQY